MDKQEHMRLVRQQIELPHASRIVCLAVVDKVDGDYRICGAGFYKTIEGLQLCGMHQAEMHAVAHKHSGLGPPDDTL